jgi:hypothetical protein
MKDIEEYGSRLVKGPAPDHIKGRYFSAEFAISVRDDKFRYPIATNTTKSRTITKISFNARLTITPTINPSIRGISIGNIHAYSAGIGLVISLV